MRPIGIMQGRLSARYLGRYQAFPIPTWQQEFVRAKDLGFSYIEFILDHNDADTNPLLCNISEIQRVIGVTGVKVRTICADYFMQAPLFREEGKKSLEVLERLLANASQLGVTDIGIPCVDQSSIKNGDERALLISQLQKASTLADKHGIFINLETDLNPEKFASLMKDLARPCFRVNYDIGNSASLGFNPSEEFAAYGKLISDLHVKDRVLGGGSILLGTGNANFDLVFSLLREYRFQGPLVMQASRLESFSEAELEHVAKQKKFAEGYISKYLGDLSA